MMKTSAFSELGRYKRIIHKMLIYLLTIGIFFVLFRKIDLKLVICTLKEISLIHLFAAALLTLSFPVLSALRWQIILRTSGNEISFSRCLLIIVGIWPISAISPSKIGDLLKIYSVRKSFDALTVAGSIILERTFDIISLAAFGLFGGIFFHNMHIIFISLIVVFGVIAVFFLVRINIPFPGRKKVQEKINQLFLSVNKISKNTFVLSLILLLTLVNWFASILQTKILFDGVGANVSLGFISAALPIAIFIGLLPITIAGMGTRDAAMISLFAPFATSHTILAVALLYSFFGYWLLSIIGIPFIKKALK